MPAASEQISAGVAPIQSLAQRSKPHVVGFWLIASRCRIDRRPAVRAESLQTDVSTIGGLSIFRWFAGQKHERAWMSDDDRSQWTAAHGLAVCAVANGRRFGIGFRLEPFAQFEREVIGER